VDERLGEVGPVEEPTCDSRVLDGVATAIPAGAGYGALVGAGSGFLVGLFPYLIGWIITAPLYASAGALLGSVAAAIVGSVGAASRSAEVGGLAGVTAGAVLGLALLAMIWPAPATPPPFGPGRPINPAATAEEERAMERDYLRWLDEQDRSERWGLTGRTTWFAEARARMLVCLGKSDCCDRAEIQLGRGARRWARTPGPS
jgi:hypothetical protein